MARRSISILAVAIGAAAGGAHAQTAATAAAAPVSAPGNRALEQAVERAPVTNAMLLHPDPSDWLMYSRTYDAHRFSPLDQINRDNVARLTRAWSVPLPQGTIETIPIVHAGVMYLVTPGGRGQASGVWALDAATGHVLWKYQPEGNLSSRAKTLAIYEDMVYFTAQAPRGEPSPIVALDAATGKVRWRALASPESHTSGAIVVDGKVLSGRTCNTVRENCYIQANDARTGKLLWRFHTTPGKGEPGDASWGGAPAQGRRASTWGLPGTYDPARHLLFWGISNPMPNTRAARHGGNAAAVPQTAPADLYSNSTVALDPDTGKLVWYYQHLPGDDWDMDFNHEKTLIRTSLDPDPRYVKWINPDLPKGPHDVVITVAEAGGIWVNDRETGKFLWATPFPYDTSHYVLSGIDVKTGITHINWDLVLDKPGKESLICYWNTRSFWPTAYDPQLNSLYVPYSDICLDMRRADANGKGAVRRGALRPGEDPAKFAGLAKIDMRTGKIDRLYQGRAGGQGAVLATAGGLVFWGDIAQVLHAFDAKTGKMLWHSQPLGATVMNSTITYAVNGRQYVAVVNGEAVTGTYYLASTAGMKVPKHIGNSINVFALPDATGQAATH